MKIDQRALRWRISFVVIVGGGLQQDITVPLHQQSLLMLDQKAATASYRSATHFQYFNSWIGVEDKIFVRTYKDKY